MLGGKEPAVVFNSLGELFKAVVPVLILFGFVHWSDKQVAGVMFLAGVAITFLTTLFTRTQTVSIPTANEQIRTAIKMPEHSTVADVIAVTEENRKDN